MPKGLKGFQKGHLFFFGGEKGWFKLGHKPTKEAIEKQKETMKRLYAEGKFVNPMKGKHRFYTEETKEKIRKSHLGLKPTEKSKHKNRLAHLGVKPTIETIEKRKLTSRGKHYSPFTEFKKGKEHPLWRGGVSFEPYGLEFNSKLKEQIRKRDNYECQECHIKQTDLDYKLHIHHIDFNKKNNTPSNLISLCRLCHHQTYFSPEEWINYYQNKVNSYA